LREQKSEVSCLIKSELRGVCGKVESITFAEFPKEGPGKPSRRKKQQQAAKPPLKQKNASVDFDAAW